MLYLFHVGNPRVAGDYGYPGDFLLGNFFSKPQVAINVTPGCGSSTLTAAVTGGAAPYTYSWTGPGGFTSTDPSITVSTGGTYSVIVTNQGLTGNSQCSSDQVSKSISINPVPIVSVADVTKCVGENATFQAMPNDAATYSYQWYKNGTIIGGATNSSYTVSTVTATMNNDVYKSVVTNISTQCPGEGSGTLQVNSLPAAAVADVAKCIGEDATFQATPNDASVYSYQWYKNGTIISDATNSSYLVAKANAADGDKYKAVITNKTTGCSAEAEGTLKVNPLPNAAVADVAKCAGEDATFQATPNDAGVYSYQWYKNGSIITGATTSSYLVAKATAVDGDKYKAIVTNKSTSCSAEAEGTLKVNALPESSVADVTKCVGENATFQAMPNDAAVYSYQWYKNGNIIGGATGSSYTVMAVTAAMHNDVYKSVVTNILTLCSAPGSGTLKVNALPNAAVADVAKCVAEDAMFQATPNDASVYSYQWYKNGNIITGATNSSYLVAKADAVNGDKYKAVVTNKTTGCSAEAEGTLTVKPLPELTAKSVDFCNDMQSNTTLSDYNGAIGAVTGDAVVWKKGADVVTTTGDLAVGTHVYTATLTRGSTSCSNSTTLTIKILGAPVLKNASANFCEKEMVGVALSSYNTAIGAQEGDIVTWKDAGGNAITVFDNLLVKVGGHSFTATVSRLYADTDSKSCDTEATLTVNVAECSGLTLLKQTNGAVNSSKSYTFAIYNGPKGFGTTPVKSETTSLTNSSELFTGVTLSANKNYTLCELNVPSGFSVVWQIDNGDGTFKTVTLYDPNGTGGDYNQGEAVGNLCMEFGPGTAIQLPTNKYGATAMVRLKFLVNNTFPQGTARTPGYWKNWSTCTGGKQVQTALKNGGKAAGFYILDDHLPHTLWSNPGSTKCTGFTLTDCAAAVKILSTQDATGKQKASDAAYNLAKHLMSYQLNIKSGTAPCASAADAAIKAEALLAKYCFNGTKDYLKAASADRTTALSYAKILDAYNNNLACAPLAVNATATALRGASTKDELTTGVYPNPTTSDATITFTVAKTGHAQVDVYNAIGAKVATLYDGEAVAGQMQSVTMKGATLPSGTYFYRVSTDGKTKTNRFLIAR
ncbi:T9SS type A sorting domain-containing protein [Hymenobacter radiodurans]|uniref:T9SS type A sorting domain-containing protein n=1 Tax=Hymenobacter radiodurans TaxID=2496028 RepID=UPI0014055AD1|nr:T9SS type A sorting domain-containing protein [Hymenobacter radiodurans]